MVVAKYIVIAFAVFIIGAGFLMLLNPQKAREIIKKAGSTPLINYGELILRMIPAAGLILCATVSKFPQFFALLGWFMMGTSVFLMLLPRKYHHAYALKCADILTPARIRAIAPLSFIFGGFLLYAIV
ncbi:hypothetical protein [uncultured Muriicola sp.]|uniref:hypothetical protein n=1 Tax=uncultured Muriicola sp. TaxID=1583102 RepID=UPI0026354EFF|nr:hypothetical protein [uncultured Muriicola sp.]